MPEKTLAELTFRRSIIVRLIKSHHVVGDGTEKNEEEAGETQMQSPFPSPLPNPCEEMSSHINARWLFKALRVSLQGRLVAN